jgi:hypothetical protein
VQFRVGGLDEAPVLPTRAPTARLLRVERGAVALQGPLPLGESSKALDGTTLVLEGVAHRSERDLRIDGLPQLGGGGDDGAARQVGRGLCLLQPRAQRVAVALGGQPGRGGAVGRLVEVAQLRTQSLDLRVDLLHLQQLGGDGGALLVRGAGRAGSEALQPYAGIARDLLPDPYDDPGLR